MRLIVVGPEPLVDGSAFRERRDEKRRGLTLQGLNVVITSLTFWFGGPPLGLPVSTAMMSILRREDLVSDLSMFLKISLSLLPHSLLGLMKSGSALMFAWASELGQELL